MSTDGQRGAGPVIATREIEEGRVVVTLGGVFDRAGVERLVRLFDELRRTATTELVIDLAGLDEYHPRLRRVLDRARIRCLIDGVCFAIVHPPGELVPLLYSPRGEANPTTTPLG